MFNRKAKTPLPETATTEAAQDTVKPGLAIKLSEDVKDALARVEETIGQQRRIDEVLNRARTELAAFESEREAAVARLSAIESEAALAAVEPDKTARRLVTSLRDQIEFATAKRSGLEGRISMANDAVVAAKHELAVCWKRWQRDIASEFLASIYAGAIEEFLTVVNQATALGMALDVAANNRLLAIARNTVLSDPSSPLQNPANPARRRWHSDAEARVLHESVLEIRRMVQPHLGSEFADTPAVMEEVADEQQPA